MQPAPAAPPAQSAGGRKTRARFGADAARLAGGAGFFTRHGGKALVLGRFTGFTRAVLPFVAGTSGLPLRRLLPYSALSGLAWTATFLVIGFRVASESFADAGETATRVTLAAVLLASALYAATARLRRVRSPA